MNIPTSLYFREDPAHPVAGSTVPRVSGAELIEAMRQNVTETQTMRDRARVRLHLLKRQGRIVVNEKEGVLRATTVEDAKGKRVPDSECSVAIADWQRACSEVRHWLEYLAWAKSTLPALPAREPGVDDGTDEQDQRLPPEKDDDDSSIPF